MFTTVNMARSVRSKNLIDELKSRDPNVGVYTNTERVVTETFALDWARIYSIFKNDNPLEVENDVQAFQNISNPKSMQFLLTHLSCLAQMSSAGWLNFPTPTCRCSRMLVNSLWSPSNQKSLQGCMPSRPPNNYSMKNS